MVYVILMSERYSMRDWTLTDMIKGNYKTIKEVLKIGIPLAVSWSVTNNPELTGLFTILGKSAFDILDYYFKEQ